MIAFPTFNDTCSGSRSHQSRYRALDSRPLLRFPISRFSFRAFPSSGRKGDLLFRKTVLSSPPSLAISRLKGTATNYGTRKIIINVMFVTRPFRIDPYIRSSHRKIFEQFFPPDTYLSYCVFFSKFDHSMNRPRLNSNSISEGFESVSSRSTFVSTNFFPSNWKLNGSYSV